MKEKTALAIAELAKAYYEQCMEDAAGNAYFVSLRLANELALAHSYIRSNKMSEDFAEKVDSYDMHLTRIKEQYE